MVANFGASDGDILYNNW